MKQARALFLSVISCLTLCVTLNAAAPRNDLIFTDEAITFPAPADAREVRFEKLILTRAGVHPEGGKISPVKDGQFSIQPNKEGIHIVRIDSGTEHRFLAMDPPARLDLNVLKKTSPRLLEKIQKKQDIVVGAYGDSVTETGFYPEILTRLLERALGGDVRVRMVRHAHPGRSIDATLRSWNEEVVPDPPDLAVIQYGLNDQGAGMSLKSFLDQAESLGRRFQEECGADVLFCQPTPDLGVFPEEGKNEPVDETTLFRTMGFGGALEELGLRLNAGVGKSFQAIWGDGGSSLQDAAIRMKPLYPPNYQSQMASLIEAGKGGDTLHPNSLGHLAIARSLLDALADTPLPAWPLRASASSHWQAGHATTQLDIRNVTDHPVKFSLALHSLPERKLILSQDAELKGGESLVLDTAPVTSSVDVPRFALVTTWENKNRVTPLAAPFEPNLIWENRRFNAVSGSVDVAVLGAVDGKSRRVVIPENEEFGSIPLVEEQNQDGKESRAVAEAGFVRYARAQPGEATTDGLLDEWADEGWSTLGAPFQARWVNGPADHRASPEECQILFALKAGREGVHLALRIRGDYAGDRFTLFFDPRESAALGSPGGYYWAGGGFPKPGVVEVSAGETSPPGTQLLSAVQTADGGATAEFFLPYAVMRATEWPVSGDLGFSFWWTHTGKDGAVTHLQWSDRGHPWNPRWFGVTRRSSDPKARMPFMVRVE